ncbi:MAG: hypothetical protein CR997_09555 [Acidobacteria bacterium]|nr:MAG: hypothetical protein CR997_09555 [Acidobacteriota bacterium]
MTQQRKEQFKKNKISVLHYFDRFLILFAVDVLLLVFALTLSLLYRDLLSLNWSSMVSHYLWFVVLIVLWSIASSSMRLYRVNRVYSADVRRMIETALVAGLTSFVYLLIPRITPFFPDRRIEALLFPVLSFVLFFHWRWFFSFVFSRKKFNNRVLLIGAGKSAKDLIEVMLSKYPADREKGSSVEILGFLDDDLKKQGEHIHGVPVLGTNDQLAKVVEELQPTEIILAITNRRNLKLDLYHALLKLKEKGWRVRTMPDVYEQLTGKIPIAHIGDIFEVLFAAEKLSYKRFYSVLMIVWHFIIGLAGSLLTLCLIPFVFLGNLLFSPGPLFYSQKRVGLSGEIFKIVKFRSMVKDAEGHTGPVWATESDSRITPFGNFLRKSRIDEFPQFFNILKGDMALIGPRPERPEFVTELEEKIPFYNLRHGIRPGITGWAQTNYTYGSSVDDAFEKMQYDFYYLKHQGLVLDLSIIFRTVLVVLGFKGR